MKVSAAARGVASGAEMVAAVASRIPLHERARPCSHLSRSTALQGHLQILFCSMNWQQRTWRFIELLVLVCAWHIAAMLFTMGKQWRQGADLQPAIVRCWTPRARMQGRRGMSRVTRERKWSSVKRGKWPLEVCRGGVTARRLHQWMGRSQPLPSSTASGGPSESSSSANISCQHAHQRQALGGVDWLEQRPNAETGRTGHAWKEDLWATHWPCFCVGVARSCRKGSRSCPRPRAHCGSGLLRATSM